MVYLYFIFQVFHQERHLKDYRLVLCREIMYQSIWNWIQQKYRPKKIFERKKKIKEFIIDETLVKSGSELIDMALVCYYYRT
jgi:hypothetical protein